MYSLAASNYTVAIGSIDLNNCISVVSLTESIKNFRFVFDVCTTERVYHLAADSEEERTEWVKTLKELLFSHSKVSFLTLLYLSSNIPYRMNVTHMMRG